jgi:Heparinase II/III-like protein/Heparinase II/III N-terminus
MPQAAMSPFNGGQGDDPQKQLKNLLRYFHTLRYLKWVQIRYRLFYVLRRRWRRWTGFKYSLPELVPPSGELSFSAGIPSYTSWLGKSRFKFLNLVKDFEGQIDWNFEGYGKLWTYNLNYFEYLHQPGVSKEQGLKLINSFLEEWENIQPGLEPFPTSLRIVSWVRFLAKYDIKEERIQRFLWLQLEILSDNREYHLLGNHLLENGFALLFGAAWFSDAGIYRMAKELLVPELAEQILPDGGHFERSPMYHSLLLFRLLEAINLLQNNPTVPGRELLPLLHRKATSMLGWLREMQFTNGELPLFNDSANGIAPPAPELLDYAKKLGTGSTKTRLEESGYRMIRWKHYEMALDAGNVGPDYIPGHAHSDTLSFELYIKEKPFIIDAGISTYEKNERRQWERSTAAHNTVQLGALEQTEIWGGFRVACRAYGQVLEESGNSIRATHNGYQRIGARHERTWQFDDTRILIKDEVTGVGKHVVKAHFHFHPSINLTLKDFTIETDFWNLQFEGAAKVELLDYLCGGEFNKLVASKKLVVNFRQTLQTTITNENLISFRQLSPRS